MVKAVFFKVTNPEQLPNFAVASKLDEVNEFVYMDINR